MQRLFLYAGLLLVVFIGSGQQPAGNRGDALFQEAQVLFDSAQYDLALQSAQAAFSFFEKAPNKDAAKATEVLLLLGNVFFEKGDFEGAFQQYTQALKAAERLGNAELKANAINGLGEYYYKTGDAKLAESHHRQALAIRQKRFGALHEEVADSYNNLGNCFVASGRYADALDMHQKALAIRQQVLAADHSDLAVSYGNLGNCYYLTGHYGAALEQFEAALKVRLPRLGAKHPKMATLYNNLGNCYLALGRSDLALRYYRQSLDLRREQLGSDHPSVAVVLENLGDLCSDQGDYLAALDYFREAYAIQRNVQEESALAPALLWHKIGLCYQYKGDYEQALRHHLEAKAVLLSKMGAQHPSVAGLFSNIGNCYADKEVLDSAEVYYREALLVFQKAYPQGHASIAQVYNNLGCIFLEKQDYSTALAWFQNTETALRQSPQESDNSLAIALKNQGLARAGLGQWKAALSNCEQAIAVAPNADWVTRLELLSGQGALLRKHGTLQNNLPMLENAAVVCAQALACLDSLRMQMTSSDTRLHWITRKYSVLAEALEANFTLWEKTGKASFLEAAFALAERGKSLQLLENLRKEQAGRFAGIPDSLLEKERSFGAELNRLEKQRLAWLLKKDTASARQTEPAIAAQRQQLSALIADFEAHYPDYFKLKYAQTLASSTTVQRELLQEGQVLIAYFVADSSLFAFVISKQSFQGVRIPKDFALTQEVLTLRSSIQNYALVSGATADSLVQQYVRAATHLYEKIVAPAEQAGAAEHKRWIIVPDGELAFLPFEALLRKQPEVLHHFKTHAYLLRDYRVSYAYSATQLIELLKNPHERQAKTMAAFAPDFENNSFGFSTLKHNRREAETIAELFDGDVLEGKAASAYAFRQFAPQYRILLLATHGRASNDPEKPSFLAFNPAKDSAFQLYVNDLYQMRLPAELVVLSACETNLGQYKAGEGVVSLAKGFFRAGTRSLVATLWSVDDAKNADLMTLFFQGISAEMPKDAALQDAKLSFLTSHPHDEAHPFYWAAAVATGDMRPMEIASPWRQYALYILVVLLLGGLAWWFRMRTN